MENKSYKSEAYYKSIVGLEFEPLKITHRQPKFLKGQLIKRKSIFGFKLSEKYAEEDLYEIIDYRGYESKKSLVNKEEYANFHHLAITENGDFAYKAKVHIHIPNNSSHYSFNTDNEAIEFLNDLKEKCMKCGNRLM